MISAPARKVLSSCLTLELGDLSKLGVVGELHPERQGVFMAATRLVFSVKISKQLVSIQIFKLLDEITDFLRIFC